jgi:hypothetical protein
MPPTKLYLTLIALNGLVLSANSVSAATVSGTNNQLEIAELSRDIARLVDIKDRSDLVELAIDRALLAQKVNVPSMPAMVTAGVPRLPTQNDKNRTESNDRPTQDNDQPKSIDNGNNHESQEIGRINKNKPATTDRPSEPRIKIPPIGRIEHKPSTPDR